MLRSLSLVMKSPAADNTHSDSMDMDGTVFQASMRKRILIAFSPFTLNIFSSFLKVFHIIIIQWFGFFQSHLT